MSDDRHRKVDAARKVWAGKLMDLSRSNRLLFYRDLQLGTLDLAVAPDAVDLLLAGEHVSLPGHDAPPAAKEDVRKKCRTIRDAALANSEERGIQTLFVAVGMATWQEPDGGSAGNAPVLLLPATLEAAGRDATTYRLSAAGDPQFNLALAARLHDFGIDVDPEELLDPPDAVEDGAPGTPAAPAPAPDADADPVVVFERLTAAAASIPGFAVLDRAVLGNFSFQKMAIVHDLESCAELLAGHDIIAALAGDDGARAAVLAAAGTPDTIALDDVPPAEDFTILDADSSQVRVVRAALAGKSGVVQGPPGTGKSQTIANTIAGLVAAGKSVLFVAEKRAALEVVLARLESAGLGSLVLDLHGADVRRKKVAERLADSLDAIRHALPVVQDGVRQQLADRRAELSAHVERLHRKREPSGMSLFEVEGALLGLGPAPANPVRWRRQALAQLDARAAEAVRQTLGALQPEQAVVLRSPESPWSAATVVDGDTALAANELVRTVLDALPVVAAAARAFAAEHGMAPAETFAAWRAQLAAAQALATALFFFRPEVLTEPLDQLAVALAPAGRGLFPRLLASWFSGTYRAAVRQIAAHARLAAPPARLLAETRAAAAAVAAWRGLGAAATPAIEQAALAPSGAAAERLGAALTSLGAILGRDLGAVPFDSLGRVAGALAADPATPLRLPAIREREQSLASLGLDPFLDYLRAERVPPGQWVARFDFAWLESCREQVLADEPQLAAFNGANQQRLVEEFAALDRRLIALNAQRVRREWAERAVEVMNAFPEQAAIVSRECQKKARHLPVRKLVEQAPDVLVGLCPCVMASPLSVSQLLAANRQYFDYVLFDEASQVLPEDAVASLVRGRQTIVAGDRHQLPPTQFFADGAGASGVDDDDDDAGAVEGFESLLDQMSAFLPPWMLEWHYRSRDERLIAFSNHYVYGGRLITFPGVGGAGLGVSAVVVDGGPASDREQSVSAEVQRVVELVLDHARTRPAEGLGVIALGITHARRIEAALRSRLRALPELDSFFAEDRPDRFFVKNLERVQGDERDAILVTLGAGKDAAGRVSNVQFGPLNGENGRRRLNVAVTRARRRLTLVSSFSHLDMTPSQEGSGTELLRHYLDYAATNGAELGAGVVTSVPMNPFEADIFDTLSAAGIPLVPQLGTSHYRLDFAAQHPEQPGRFVLAIECDGAAYHSAESARDRDRLRQQHLEDLGWRFLRIWSSDWFTRREHEVDHALAAYKEALIAADRAPAAAPSPPPASLSPPPDAAAAIPSRAPRPRIPAGRPIDEYAPREIDTLIRWILSDGALRTDEAIAAEARRELGFARRGRRIDEALTAAIARVTGA